ncbi:N-acetylmuramoyl-L-alanine amidase [Acinetobacter indicus]|uniref:N-acetylmuramoyl-L-alanine amidase n=1 Tax=Acinetobacter indicus TaxID=756892 RepID=UPI0012663136|nr:N-acetylmuramoyl-L-alanine amidase [Acinetobacter indicus]QFS17049.1 N-acetylmuramoyl-L-alanine amidase [Acinetobacter indicus]
MKFIEQSAFKYLSVKLPYLGAFLMLLVLVLQWALDFELIPQQYAPFIVATVLPILSHIGKKIYQPALHTSPLGFVTVTAGHSNKDPGAVNGKIKESELVTNFRNAVAYYLHEAGVTTLTDGSGSKNDPLSAALKLIKGSTVAVEFHMNAAASKQANGIETISLPQDKQLAQDLSAAVASALGSRLRGDNGWIDQSKSARGSLAYINAGGLIVELGFISNEAELAAFQSRYWIAAKAVAKVLIDYEKAR